MSIQGLSAQEGQAVDCVKDFCSHNYPQSASTANLAQLMNHSYIASQIKPFAAEVAAADHYGVPHIFGETQSGKSLEAKRKRALLTALKRLKVEVA